MASVLAGIQLIATADTTGIKLMASSLNAFAKQVKDNTKEFGTIAAIGATFLGLGTSIAGGLTGVMAVSMEYENLIQRFATTSRMAASGVVQIHDRLLTLSAGMATSAEDLARLSVQAGRLGLDAGGVEKFTLAAAKLSTISGGAITGANAIDQLDRIMTVFKLDPASSVDKLSSAFVGLSRSTTASVSDLSEIVARTGELGHTLGFTAPQLAGLAATASDLGLRGRRAAGAIEGLFSAMTGRDSVRHFANMIHMSGQEFERSLGRDPMAILKKLQGAFNGIDPRILEDRLKHMGVTENSVRTLVLGLAGDTGRLTRNVALANEEFIKGTAANEAYEELLGSTKMTLDVFLNGLHAVAVTFGEILLPVFRAILNVGIRFMQFLLAIPTPIKVVMVAIAAITAGLTALIGTVILGAVAIGSLVMAFATWAGEMVAASELMLINMGELLGLTADVWINVAAWAADALAMGAFGEDLVLLIGQLFLGEVGLGEFTAGLYGLAAAAVTAEMLTGIGEILLIIAAAAAVVYVAWLALEPVFKELWNSMMLLAEPFEVLLDGAREIGAMFSVSGGSGIGSILLTFVRIGLFPVILQIKSMALGFRILASILRGFASGVVSLVKPIIEPFARLYNVVGSTLAGALTTLVNIVSSFTGVGSEAASVFGSIASVAEFVFTYLTPLGMLFRSIGIAVQFAAFVIESAWDGVSDALEPLLTEVQGSFILISQAFGAVGDAVDEMLLPFKLMLTEWGLLGEGGDFLKSMIHGLGQAIGFVVHVFLWPFIAGIRLMVGLVTAIGRAIAFEMRIVVKAIELIIAPLKKAFEIVTSIAAAIGGLISKKEEAPAAVSSLVPTPPENEEKAAERILPASIRRRINAPPPLPGRPMHAVLRHELIHGGFGDRNRPEARLRPSLFEPRAPEVAKDRGHGDTGEAIRAAVAAALAARPSESKSGSGAMTITVPVTVMLDDMEIGRAVAYVSDDELRRQFGTRKLRLSGIG